MAQHVSNDSERRRVKRPRLSNETSVSRVEGSQHRHDAYEHRSAGALGAPASLSSSISVQYEHFGFSGEVPVGCQDNSFNWQYQSASLHASTLPHPLAFATEASLPSYTESHKHLLHRDAYPSQSLTTIWNPEIVGASALNDTFVDGEADVVVCFGMVNQISFFGVVHR